MDYEWDTSCKIFVPKHITNRVAAKDHHALLLEIVRAAAGRPASLSAQAATYIGKIILADPTLPKGIGRAQIKKWVDEQVVRGTIEAAELARENRHKGKCVALTPKGLEEAGL